MPLKAVAADRRDARARVLSSRASRLILTEIHDGVGGSSNRCLPAWEPSCCARILTPETGESRHDGGVAGRYRGP